MKKSELRKLIREEIQNVLSEDHLGYIKGNVFSGVGVYKNPKSIKRMESYIRGISDSDGNFYVVDSGEESRTMFIHTDIAKWLRSKGHISYPGSVYDPENMEKFVMWQRDRNTNNFFLSESYEERDFEDREFKEIVEELIDAVSTKNPQYNFYLDKIPMNAW